MEEIILISYLNDFVFCPISIYFHKLYGNVERILYQTEYQLNGTDSHLSIDNRTYSSRKNVLQGIDVYTDEFGILGKIDIFDIDKGILIERKNKIIEIYDGYIYQVYAQYYALTEMGYQVNKIKLYSIKDNKSYIIKLPIEDIKMDNKFRSIIKSIREFNIENFEQSNCKKCEKCIYEPSCDRSCIKNANTT